MFFISKYCPFWAKKKIDTFVKFSIILCFFFNFAKHL